MRLKYQNGKQPKNQILHESICSSCLLLSTEIFQLWFPAPHCWEFLCVKLLSASAQGHASLTKCVSHWVTAILLLSVGVSPIVAAVWQGPASVLLVIAVLTLTRVVSECWRKTPSTPWPQYCSELTDRNRMQLSLSSLWVEVHTTTTFHTFKT